MMKIFNLALLCYGILSISLSCFAQEIEMFEGTWTRERYFKLVIEPLGGGPVTQELRAYLKPFQNESADQKWDRMVLWIKENIQKRPEMTERLYLQLGSAYLLTGEWQNAYDTMKVLCLEMNSQEPSAWIQFATACQRLHKKEVYDYALKGVFLDSPEIKMEYQKGIEARNQHDFERAREHFLKCETMLAQLKSIRLRNFFLFDVAFIDYRLGKWQELMADLSCCGQWWRPEIICTLMPMLNEHMDEVEQVVDMIGELIAKEPLPIYYAWRARFRAMRCEFSDVVYNEYQQKIHNDLKMALQKAPQNPDVLTICAGTWFLLNDWEKCRQTCNFLEKQQFENQTWCFWKAMVLLRQGEYESAIELLKTYVKYCEICPTESFFNVSMGQAFLAICYAKLNQFDNAEQILSIIHSSFPEDKRRMLEMLLYRAQKKAYPEDLSRFLKEMNNQLENGTSSYADFLFVFLCAEHKYGATNSKIASYLIAVEKLGKKNVFFCPTEMNILADKAVRYILRLDKIASPPSVPVVYLETNGNEWFVLQNMLLR